MKTAGHRTVGNTVKLTTTPAVFNNTTATNESETMKTYSFKSLATGVTVYFAGKDMDDAYRAMRAICGPEFVSLGTEAYKIADEAISASEL